MNTHRALLLFAVLASPLALASPPVPPVRADAPAETSQAQVARQAAALRQLGSELRAAAKQPPRMSMDRFQAAKVREYNAWLDTAAQSADALAAEGEALSRGGATDAQAADFGARYRQLQARLDQENRSRRDAAALHRTKHDTVKNAINNVR
jgi:hypothetical protein